ncbi:MAG: ATP-binding cassette domain-containing protein [Bacteroidales bacterium]|nr:ATP-binding cassette domain-containing protein [Bacteroidales bacterium]MBR3286574.1 ATP-binding cassette domain-containing protein [Bacteroidales bacterium]
MGKTVIDMKLASIFQGDHLVLTDVSFQVEAGEMVYLIGRVGTGKTSLLKTLNAELPLRQGEATIAGFPLHTLRRRDVPMLRRKIGVIFQQFQLLSDRSVYDNLLFVLRATGWKAGREADARIKEVLQRVGMQTKDYKMPHQLSGGEQQRVAIARALLNNPEVILADEPTGNLDPETVQEIMRIFVDICQAGTAVLFITHNYALLRQCPGRILKCEYRHLKEMQRTRNEGINFDDLMDELDSEIDNISTDEQDR